MNKYDDEWDRQLEDSAHWERALLIVASVLLGVLIVGGGSIYFLLRIVCRWQE